MSAKPPPPYWDTRGAWGRGIFSILVAWGLGVGWVTLPRAYRPRFLNS